MICAALLALASLAGAARAAAALVAHGSADQVYATGLRVRAQARLLDRHGRTVAIKAGDAQGGVLFRQVAPGRGYRVRAGALRSTALTVFTGRDAPPHHQRLRPAAADEAATDTCARATGLVWRSTSVCRPGRGRTRRSWSTRATGTPNPAGAESGISPIANLLGFAVVDVNMRGTGCSGGAYDYFERLQSLDGYDVIETVARQPWVLGHRVGMTGISYGGISQLFVGATDPPHLAAITPLSVIDSTITTLYPGGILNTGFALTWGKERAHDALPASPTGGQPWALKRIRGGDRICAANQALHGEATNLIATIRHNSHYSRPSRTRWIRSRSCTASRAPTYLACQWEDEQTGGHCADLAQHSRARAAPGSRSPTARTSTRWTRRRSIAGTTSWSSTSPIAGRRCRRRVRALAPLCVPATMGISGVTLPPDPIQSEPSYRGGARRLRRLAPIRVLFDNGPGARRRAPRRRPSSSPSPVFRSPARAPAPGFCRPAAAWPRPRPARAGADRFAWRPNARLGHELHRSGRRRPGRPVERDARAITGVPIRPVPPPPT